MCVVARPSDGFINMDEDSQQMENEQSGTIFTLPWDTFIMCACNILFLVELIYLHLSATLLAVCLLPHCATSTTYDRLNTVGQI